jgi:hypothetical protein
VGGGSAALCRGLKREQARRHCVGGLGAQRKKEKTNMPRREVRLPLDFFLYLAILQPTVK